MQQKCQPVSKPPVFRVALPGELSAVMEIINDGKLFLAQQGVDQWQSNNPNEEMLAADIAAGRTYILEAGGIIAGTLAVCPGREPDYDRIEEGAWGTASHYVALHRVAMAKEARSSGLAAVMLQSAEALCAEKGFFDVRIDTHRHNQPMQKFLQKNGYTRRGIIYLTDGGDERIAFDKKL